MSKRDFDKLFPMTSTDAYQVTLLSNAQVCMMSIRRRIEALEDRALREKRLYWLDKISKDIEALDSTYPGHITEGFEAKYEVFEKILIKAINDLFKEYGGLTDELK